MARGLQQPGNRKRGHYERGLFTEESLESLNSLESLENCRILLCFPQSGRSLESLVSLRISRKSTFLKRPRFQKTPLFSKLEDFVTHISHRLLTHASQRELASSSPSCEKDTEDWEKNLQGLKSWAWLTTFCRTLPQQAFHYVNPSAEPSCRTPQVPQNTGGGAQTCLLRNGFFSPKLSQTIFWGGFPCRAS